MHTRGGQSTTRKVAASDHVCNTTEMAALESTRVFWQDDCACLMVVCWWCAGGMQSSQPSSSPKVHVNSPMFGDGVHTRPVKWWTNLCVCKPRPYLWTQLTAQLNIFVNVVSIPSALGARLQVLGYFTAVPVWLSWLAGWPVPLNSKTRTSS